MAEKNFSLKDIKLLADQYSRSGSPEAVALFQAVQSFYPPGTKLKQPSNPPSKVEMARRWKYDKKEEAIIEVID